MAAMRDRLERGILASGHDVRVNGHPTERLPNTCSVGFRGLEADRILDNLPTVAASAGAACHSDQVELSHVLEAMRAPTEYAMGTLRLNRGPLHYRRRDRPGARRNYRRGCPTVTSTNRRQLTRTSPE